MVCGSLAADRCFIESMPVPQYVGELWLDETSEDTERELKSTYLIVTITTYKYFKFFTCTLNLY